MTNPKWFQYPQRFDPHLLNLVGAYVAAAGMIERCIFNGLVLLREQGFEAAQGQIRSEFGKRHNQWLDAVKQRFDGDTDNLELIEKLFIRTKSLIGHRHLLVHSFWFGMDEDKVLYLQQAVEKKGQYQSRAFEIEMKYLAAHAQGIQPLIDLHMHFLHERLLRNHGTIQEVALPEAWSPMRLKNPNPQGWPPPGGSPHRLGLKK